MYLDFEASEAKNKIPQEILKPVIFRKKYMKYLGIGVEKKRKNPKTFWLILLKNQKKKPDLFDFMKLIATEVLQTNSVYESLLVISKKNLRF